MLDGQSTLFSFCAEEKKMSIDLESFYIFKCIYHISQLCIIFLEKKNYDYKIHKD